MHHTARALVILVAQKGQMNVLARRHTMIQQVVDNLSLALIYAHALVQLFDVLVKRIVI